MTALLLAFIGTNVDGFLCIAAAFAVDPPRNRFGAVLASSSSFALLLAVSLVASVAIGRLGANAAWFGLIPAAIGVIRLWRLIAGGSSSSGGRDWLSSGASIFSIVLATGADNVAVYTPLFAVRPLGVASAVAAVYLACWIAGCAVLAFATPALPRVHAFKRYLEPAMAIAFVAAGIAIVLQPWMMRS